MTNINIQLNVILCVISTIIVVALPYLILCIPLEKLSIIKYIIKYNDKEKFKAVLVTIIMCAISAMNNISLVANKINQYLNAGIQNLQLMNVFNDIIIRSLLISVSCAGIVTIAVWIISKCYQIADSVQQVEDIQNQIDLKTRQAYEKRGRKRYTRKDNIIYLGKNNDKL